MSSFRNAHCDIGAAAEGFTAGRAKGDAGTLRAAARQKCGVFSSPKV
jgi:hypothetical protein